MPSIEEIADLLKNSSTEEISRLLSLITQAKNEPSVEERNEVRVEEFAVNLISNDNPKTRKYRSFLESSSINGIITSATQVGKTQATRKFIETCFENNVPVIVSTDNKTDQLEQMYSRIRRDLLGANVLLLKIKDNDFIKRLESCLDENNKRFVIFGLDNSVQITKLLTAMKVISYHINFKNISKFALIHDEGDVITKDKNIYQVLNSQPQAHKCWIKLVDFMNKELGDKISLKRVFVTATPENPVMMYDIKTADLIRLEIPESYRGYRDIQYNFHESSSMKAVIEKEVSRVQKQKTYEVLLYCVERKIEEGQDIVLEAISSMVDCIVNTYNGNGISVVINDKTKFTKFVEELMKKKRITFVLVESENKINIKKLAIREFYTICKKVGENCVITIGKDLISRGISYVSEDEIEPMTATTMFYVPGNLLHAVGISQAIGRITGCAAPEYARRLYASKEVIDTYVTYNRNQEMYMDKIEEEYSEYLTKDIIADIKFDKIKRSIDRPKLQIKMTYKKEEKIHVIEDENRMIHLINLWWKSETIIGKILRFVYNSKNGVEEYELKKFIKESGSTNISSHYQELVKHDNRKYNIVFERNDKNTNLTKNAREYLDKLKN